MATTSSFKTYERDVRYQTTQAAFTSGMYYADTPIPEGAAKVLVNYDVSMDGMSIKPRRGLCTKKIAMPESDSASEIFKAEVVDSKVCYHNDKEFIQLIIKTPVPEQDAAYISIYTVDNSKQESAGAFLKTGYKVAHTFKKDNEDTGERPVGVFNTEECVSAIHNLAYMNKAQHVGCFINDQYFFFNKAKDRLVYTQFNPTTEQYDMHELEPQATTQAQAQQMGFNMLLDSPYTYADVFVEGSAESTVSFSSINAFEDEACTTPAQQELIKNQLYYYRISYSGAGTLRLKFDWTTANNVAWQELSEQSITITEALPKIMIPFRAPVDRAIIRCTAYRDDTPVDIIWFAFDYQDSITKAVKDITKFTLSTGTTMTYWQHRLVIAGTQEDKSYLFTSAPKLFEYFPFPNNADYLDEPIIAVHELLDNLLVFTKSKLYLYTLDPLTGLTRKCIQTNLNIKEAEACLIKIVKNMAYFKSGNYYYMVVPKLNSTTGELTIAPVYRYVKALFDDFEHAAYDIIQEVYGIVDKPLLQKVHNYLDYEAIHNVYMFELKESLYINFDLLYNTVKRTWSIYLYESPSAINVYKQDATKAGNMLTLVFNEKTVVMPSGARYIAYTPQIQLIEWDSGCQDALLPHIVEGAPTVPIVSQYNNKQFIDTGAIDINSNYKKRFREIQFRVLNNSSETLEFATTFFIDGVTRTPEFVYTPVIDASAGVLTLNKELISVAPITATHKGHTRLGSWKLSQNSFPGTDIVKIRIPVSGKGYNSQIKINCDNQYDYTLLDVSNVYRQLYSR